MLKRNVAAAAQGTAASRPLGYVDLPPGLVCPKSGRLLTCPAALQSRGCTALDLPLTHLLEAAEDTEAAAPDYFQVEAPAETATSQAGLQAGWEGARPLRCYFHVACLRAARGHSSLLCGTLTKAMRVFS